MSIPIPDAISHCSQTVLRAGVVTDDTCDSITAGPVPSLSRAAQGPCWGAGVAAVPGIPPTVTKGTELSSISFTHFLGLGCGLGNLPDENTVPTPEAQTLGNHPSLLKSQF